MTDDQALPFRAFIIDLLNDPRFLQLSWAEQGMFLRLLFHSWLQDGLPVSVAAIAALLHQTPATCARRAWPRLRALFTEVVHADGMPRFVYERQEVERRRFRAARASRLQEITARQLRASRAAKRRWTLKVLAGLCAPYLA